MGDGKVNSILRLQSLSSPSLASSSSSQVLGGNSMLQEKHLQLQGKRLSILSLKELQHLEKQLDVALIYVRERKELMLTKQLEESRLKEQRAELENETLHRQVQELRSFLPSINQHYAPSYIRCFAIDSKTSLLNNTCLGDINCSLQNTNSDTTLQLGYVLF
ncbi:hypothetical protein Bca52824_039877 [Brassica carinata]|uniref:K-box domain-containing protein n=2 Tax=Brassica TaxID=3705 RepID=A0A8X7RTU3_BRACI|nr:hypothetical protein Bca52824_039877 [Brassica carinata]CAF1707838.1 unnamed protein product [Brassica napus]